MKYDTKKRGSSVERLAIERLSEKVDELERRLAIQEARPMHHFYPWQIQPYHPYPNQYPWTVVPSITAPTWTVVGNETMCNTTNANLIPWTNTATTSITTGGVQ